MVDKIQSDFYKQWEGTRVDLAISSDTTIDAVSEYITVDTSGGKVQVTLPDTSTAAVDGKKVWIINSGGVSGKKVTVLPNGSDGTTINGKSQFVITKNMEVGIFELTGPQWTVLNCCFDADDILTDLASEVIVDNDGDVILEGEE